MRGRTAVNITQFVALPCVALALVSVSVRAEAATDLQVCNKTGSKVFVALVTLPDSTKKWTLDAWHAVNAGACRSVATVRTGLFYYFAEKEGRKMYWPAANRSDKNFCLPSARVRRELTAAACASGERSLGFIGTVPSEGKYIINLQ